MDTALEFLSKLEIGTILAVAAMFWWFNNRMDKKFEKLEHRIDQRFEKVDQRFEKLEDRMTRMEYDMIEVKTVLRLKECCMIQDERQTKKAE